MINKLIKNFIFDERLRKEIIFSDASKVRLNSENSLEPRIQLKKDSGNYPLDLDIFVETPLIMQNALNKWLGFEVIVVEDPETKSIPLGTSLGFKIKTTGDDYFWDGIAWAIAGLSDWSTEAEINTNLETLPIATIGNKDIGIITNLITTDKTKTPEVKEIKFLGEFDIEYFEDLIYDGVIRLLNSSFRSSSVVIFPTDSAISSINLDSILNNKAYNITGIKKVINLTDDSLKLTNLLDGYSPGALRQDGFTNEPGTVTFLSSIPINKLVEITFEYVPEIIIKTGQDYFEIPVYPSLVFTRISEVNRKGFTIRDTNSVGVDFIRNKAALTAVKQFAPSQKSYRFSYSIFTGLQLDQLRLSKDLNGFFARNKFIKSYALGCEYGLEIIEEIDTLQNKTNDNTDINVASGIFDVLGVLAFDKESIDLNIVQNGNVIINGKDNIEI